MSKFGIVRLYAHIPLLRNASAIEE